ncbi:MAG: GTPase Era [Hyphomicrobium sp.]|nr:MAG: GTPase Era [Hyphomicrobium sp.]
MIEPETTDDVTTPRAENPQPADRRCGFIAILGAPNAGKSTLINALVGSKVAIVSQKVQTTRVPVRGIAIEGKSQLVFIDTPGIFRPKRRLDRAMVEAAWAGAGDADAVLFLIDAARGLDEDALRIIEKLGGAPGRQRIAVLNKVDRVEHKENLLGLAAELVKAGRFERVFMISALSASGVLDVKQYLATVVPPGPWHYDEDDVTDAPMRLFAAEITREKIYKYLHDELPYATTVETTSWQDRKDGSTRVEQTIFVERDGQRSIVIGKGGQAIKQISTEARRDMALSFERPIHLFLFVKVRENWGSDPERYREMGLEYPKDET